MSYHSEVLADGPAGYWKLDETSGTTASDSSGNGRHGTYGGGILLGKTPVKKIVQNYAVLADGYNDYVGIPYNAALATAQLTVEILLVPFGGTYVSSQTIASKAQSGGWFFVIDSTGVTFHFNAYIDGAYRTVSYTPPALADVGFHVVVTYDSRYLRMYVDGVQVAQYDHGSNANITYSVNNSLLLASDPDSGSSPSNNTYYRGRLSNFAYYNYALSAARVAAHYAALTRSVAITISEQLAATQFIIGARRAVDGESVGHAVTGNGAQTLSVDTYDPVMVTVAAYQGNCWKPSISYAIDDLVFPTDPITTPYYYKRIAAGTSGASEPTWPTNAGGQCDDGAVTNAWQLVERLIQPISHGPLIPG
jgi:hypothetical protein